MGSGPSLSAATYFTRSEWIAALDTTESLNRVAVTPTTARGLYGNSGDPWPEQFAGSLGKVVAKHGQAAL
jgi:hypothetical protein